jgi:hypothetical protein
VGAVAEAGDAELAGVVVRLGEFRGAGGRDGLAADPQGDLGGGAARGVERALQRDAFEARRAST